VLERNQPGTLNTRLEYADIAKLMALLAQKRQQG
jgi:hypothetical protein